MDSNYIGTLFEQAAHDGVEVCAPLLLTTPVDVHSSVSSLREIERDAILRMLQAVPHKPTAAKLMGISLKTLYNKLHRYQK